MGKKKKTHGDLFKECWPMRCFTFYFSLKHVSHSDNDVRDPAQMATPFPSLTLLDSTEASVFNPGTTLHSSHFDSAMFRGESSEIK